MRKTTIARNLVVMILCISFGVPALTHAAWSDNPAVNTPISLTGGDDVFPAMISDGAGGAIIAWMGLYLDIYAQKIDPQGNPKWAVNGVALSSGGDKDFPQLVSDGAGGAIVTWQDDSSGPYDIYAQRVASNGSVSWTSGGVAICTAANNQWYPQIVSDGAGGAIITWQDSRTSELNYDIYAQRIDADGNVKWQTDGVPICTMPRHQYNPQAISDDSGGAIITWWDNRSYQSSNDTGWDIYAQRIDATGDVKWTPQGVAVCSAVNDQYYPQIVSDDAGGAIITWQDDRSGATPTNTSTDIYAQRLDANGNALWTPDGVAVSTPPNNQWNPQIASDGSGGAVIAWFDNRDASNDWYVYAQRVDTGGVMRWTRNGVAISRASGIDSSYKSPQIIGDGSGGAVIAWADARSGIEYGYDVYAQKIDAAGDVKWTANGANGAAIATAPSHQQLPKLISDGAGGAIITWQDVRSGDWNIYAQEILANETLPCTTLSVRISETFRYFLTVGEAYNAANSGDTLKMKALDLIENNLLLGKDVSVLLQGGYAGCDYLSNPGFTTIHGTLTVRSGTVTVENVAIL